MADHLTEEEQIQALKNWWNTYWKSVVVPIVLAAGGYYGWTVWQDQQLLKAEAGGVKFQQLLDAMEQAPGTQLEATQLATARLLAGEIVEEFDGSLYADHANMILARLAVEEGDLSAADAYLQRVIDEGANASIKSLASARLARVKVGQGDHDAGLALVSGSAEGAYKSLYAEIRGDALAAQGKADAARTAYQEALDSLPANQFNRRSVIQLKIDGVDIVSGIVKAPPEPVEEAPEAPAAEGEETPAEPSPEAENS